ncbi:hypothetical protein PSN45_002872 [Yamadazyma tenuis]|uniref:uncharacterized protein n=1 Tax=Candida tenuis TaxID=2315449 RepID=UPI0027A4B6DB|nr:hypothetical protein PSN45_002872 [Yamadazyma tenuis]
MSNDLYKLQRRSLTPFLSKRVPPIPSEEERTVYPESKANIVSQMFFGWLIPLFNVGYKRTLQPEDMYSLTENTKVEYLAGQFNTFFNHYLPIAKEQHIANKCKDRGETVSTSSVDPDDDLEDFKVPRMMVLWCLFLTCKWTYLGAIVFVTLSGLAQCLTPLLTKALIKYVEMKTLGLEHNTGRGVGLAIGAVIMVMFAALTVNQGFYRGMMTGAQLKGVLGKVMLEKSFRLNPQSRHQFPASKITSMMSTDTARIDFAATFQPFLITFPISLACILVVLIVNLGASALMGLAVLVLFLVGIGGVSKKMFAVRKQATVFTDQRVNYIKEVLNNLKIIKFYSWEEAYFKIISDVRTKEMDRLYIMQVLRNIVITFSLTLSTFASIAAFLVLYSTGSSKSNPANIFSSISLFNVFSTVVFMVPMALSSLMDALVGIDRIGNFLNATEVAADEGRAVLSPEAAEKMNENGLALRLSKASFEWEKFDDFEEEDEKTKKKRLKQEKKDEKKRKKMLKKGLKVEVSKEELSDVAEKTPDSDTASFDNETFPGLNDLDFVLKKGEFVVVTGLIGSGKSSLLNAVAGFMKKSAGTVDINGSLTFCGQPWIQNTSVKENILFGAELDEKKYKDVIYACSLESDLEILPAGDRTEIGERGITLSGGQKARINLARSVYADNDIILLDDVLSAVDARVGKHIMENCILGLLKDKTRILATHQLSLIGAADRIIFLNGDGSVSIGTGQELERTNPGYTKLMTFNTQKDDSEEEYESDDDSEVEEEERRNIQRQLTRTTTGKSKISVIDEEAIHKDYNQDQFVSGKLAEDEEQSVNSIGFQVYKRYVKMGQGIFKHYSILLVIFSFLTVATFCNLFTNTWLSFWSEKKFTGKSNGLYIGIYVMFGILTFIFTLIAFIGVGYMTNRASRELNILAIEKVLYSPMSFLDTTPMGRIINRFTKDTDVLDNEISDQLRFSSFLLWTVFGVLILCIIYLPWFAIAVPPLFLMVYLIAEYYQSSAREIKRIEAVQRSFVYNNFNETLVGRETISAYNSERRFLDKNDYYTDRMNEAYYLTIASQRWIGINLETIICILPLIITLLSVFRVFNLTAASVGLLVSYVITIAGQVSFVVRSYTQVENGMNSTERLCDFAFDLEQEAAFEIPETKPDPTWPQQGQIEFTNVSMAYREGLPLVLKHLDATIKPQEKIGICGRTGAGKSSLVTALYRMSELNAGLITIDGVDISKIGLKDLRTKLSIIPQDPVLFRGTIRKNLDPFEQSSDEKLWDALRKSGLIEADRLDAIIRQQKGDENLFKFHLDQPVEDEGTNFSLGERQLISLARALVRDSKILILDEATSSVDYETDSKIQETIVREFSQCTILCIAHRLRTIVNYDKILVLDKGEVKEFDSPWNLYNQQDSIFQQMCFKSKIEAEDFTRR